MLKILCNALLILLLSVPCYADMNGYVAGSSAAAVACGVQDSATTRDSDRYLGYTNMGTCVWGSFTPSSTYLAKNFTFYLKKGGAPTGTITVFVCDDSDGTNATAVGTISEASLTTSYAEYSVSYPTGYQFSSGTRRWFRLSVNRAESGSAITYVGYNSDDSENVASSVTTTCTYSEYDTSAILYYKTSTCE